MITTEMADSQGLVTTSQNRQSIESSPFIYRQCMTSYASGYTYERIMRDLWKTLKSSDVDPGWGNSDCFQRGSNKVEYFHYYYFILFCLRGAYDRSLWNSNIFVFLDIDECSASPPVCDVNANCSNTRGSYICTCKAGYNGDGKICRGRRE